MRQFLRRHWTQPPTGRIIDIVAQDPEGNVILGLVDLTHWGSTQKIIALQQRINLCMEFWDSEQFLEDYPNSEGKQVTVRIYLGVQPDEEGITFLRAVSKSVESFGVIFEYQEYEN